MQPRSRAALAKRNASDRLRLHGIPATRRERIESAVETGGRHVKKQYEGWIASDPFRGRVRMVVTGVQGVTGSSRHLVQSPPPKLGSAPLRRLVWHNATSDAWLIKSGLCSLSCPG